ncbi:DgyrCDS12220 [Dimorphilus gyrociliatus]|uniref:Mitochondrial import inner membrane translocase subunit TIM44 n=1 Tax=Dimorphilus gyrociliatus TaxID=2664684 RepID=A0A7I8W706_9ANNE|nr:DgyrCDS12220 [Dimorphilus gyrociliatus]
MSKNKEMKENLKKFRKEAEKLEQSEALQKAREKYQTIEQETAKSSEVLKEKFDELKDKAKKTLEEAEKIEGIKKSMKIGKGVVDSASKMGENVIKSGEQIGQTAIFKTVSQGVKAVTEEINDATIRKSQFYKEPKVLRKRSDNSLQSKRHVEANEDATGVVMHKDSKFFQSWQNFKENNQFVTKLFDMKTKYDESDNVMVRTTRAITDKLTDIFGNVFSKTEMSEVITEITKMDPNFDQIAFIKQCEKDIIPNVLEAIVRPDLEILEDWCHEAAYNTIAHPIQQAIKKGYVFENTVLDVGQVDIVSGKMMEQGPVLIITFNAQQIFCARDTKGFVVEGEADKVMRVLHVWALCRDQTILDPRAAWRVVDLSVMPQEQWL